jgi:hypothetical protein
MGIGFPSFFFDVLYPLVVVFDEAMAWKALLFYSNLYFAVQRTLFLASVYRVNCIGIVRDRSIAASCSSAAVLSELDYFQRSSHARPRLTVP